MPGPYALERLVAGEETFITRGPHLVWRYETADVGSPLTAARRGLRLDANAWSARRCRLLALLAPSAADERCPSGDSAVRDLPVPCESSGGRAWRRRHRPGSPGHEHQHIERIDRARSRGSSRDPAADRPPEHFSRLPSRRPRVHETRCRRPPQRRASSGSATRVVTGRVAAAVMTARTATRRRRSG